MIRRFLLLAVTAIAVALSVLPALADKRIALVIGNSAYLNVPRLENPRNDALLMASTLAGARLHPGRRRRRSSISTRPASTGRCRNSATTLQGADVGDVLLCRPWRAGARRRTTSCRSAPIRRARRTSISRWSTSIWCCARWRAPAPSSIIVVLDACRNNPFGGRGLRADRRRTCADARAGGHADFVCDPAGQRRARRRRQQPLHQGAGGDDPQDRARHLPDLQRGRALR